MLAEEMDGTPINDAIFERNLFLNEIYNFNIELTTGANMQQEIAQLVTSGDQTYDVFAASAGNSMASARNGYYYNLHSLESIDLNNPWWDHSLIDPLTIENRAFVTTGDITIVPKEGVRVFFFNKELREMLQLESPYDLVNEGRWTFDIMFSMLQGAESDLNGDGKIDDNDRYAFQGTSDFPMLFYIGSGEYLISKDENDIMYYSAETERSLTVLEHITELIAQTKDICLSTRDWQGMLKKFNNDQALFYTDAALHIETMRSYDVEFGVLPAPKFDEQQENHINYIDYFCNIFYAIPISAGDPENTAYLLEIISASSQHYLTPAYYDVCLKTKYSRDEESSAMLDIIFDTYRVDLADIYSLPIETQVCEMMGSGTNYFSSLFAAHRKAVPKQLTKIHEAYRKTEAFDY